jgi:hypothetical protein
VDSKPSLKDLPQDLGGKHADVHLSVHPRPAEGRHAQMLPCQRISGMRGGI